MTNDGRKALVNFKIGVISYYLANVCALNKNSQIDPCTFPMNVSENAILILVSPSNGSVTPLNILKIIAYTYTKYTVSCLVQYIPKSTFLCKINLNDVKLRVQKRGLMVTCIYMKISENLNFSKGFCKLNKAY